MGTKINLLGRSKKTHHTKPQKEKNALSTQIGCEFRWGFPHLYTLPLFSLCFRIIFPFACCPVRRQSIPEGQTSLCLIHKQPIVMQSGLALHLIFTYLNTSPPLPPTSPDPTPPPSTDFMSRLWNETVAFSIGAERTEQRPRMRYFSHSQTSFPISSFGTTSLLLLCIILV